ncbi:membrane protein containing DUF58 [mine drainage metagenome]|uniref:Membrane protein containing DUF58 n=2 Tax=mine drainage metagenome TaxID=410659 RepID=T1BV23_9ZZZZ
MPPPATSSPNIDSGTAQRGSRDWAEASREHIAYRRTYILPTRFGLAFAFMLFALFLGAMNYNNNMAFFLVFLLTGLALFSMTRTHRNLVGLRIGGMEASPVFAGEPMHVRLMLENPAAFARLDLTLSTRRGKLMGPPLDLAPGGQGLCLLEVPTRVRGRFELRGLRLASRRPLGLFRAFHPLSLPVHSMVYPKPADPPRPLPASPSTSSRARSHRVESEDFKGLRPYRHGDGRKRISWPAYAKGLGLLIKDFEMPAGQEIQILRWADAPGNPEERLSHLTRWVTTLAALHLEYGLELPTGGVPASQGSRHLDHCLTCLALYPGRVR